MITLHLLFVTLFWHYVQARCWIKMQIWCWGWVSVPKTRHSVCCSDLVYPRVYVSVCCVVIVMILRGRELRKLALSPPATLLPHLDIYQQLDRDIIWNIVTSHLHSTEIRFWPCWRCIQLQEDEWLKHLNMQIRIVDLSIILWGTTRFPWNKVYAWQGFLDESD